ncbi:MAG TPA: MFS transporter [Candidatus Saccharimonadales bacterium]|nr:MFS transporter [Candidatus Saccharimonadales bacterium]
MSVVSPAVALPPPRPVQDWRILVVVFWVTSMVEGLGISQIFALIPTSLRQMGVPEDDRLAFVGLFSALIFLVGLPLVPLWGVWADKYSRKAVIVRSALVEAVVFAGVALSREPWQLALSMLLIGFQLGNTGVMLAAIRDVSPRRRIGTIMGIFGASSAVGMAAGPALAGLLIDGFGWALPAVFWLSAALSVGTAVLVTFGSREVRPEIVPQGSVINLAFGAVRNVLRDPAVRRIFVIFGVSFLALQMSRPYIPVLVEGLAGTGPGLASAIALVMGTAALVGGLIAPFGGVLGDRVGFRRVLMTALAGAGVALLLMPFVPSVASLAGLAVVLSASSATVSAMVFGLVATELPPERRSATLNLVYLPLYAAGIIGPAVSAGVASVTGVEGPFIVGSVVFFAGAAAIALRGRRRHRRISADAGPAPADEARTDPTITTAGGG